MLRKNIAAISKKPRQFVPEGLKCRVRSARGLRKRLQKRLFPRFFPVKRYRFVHPVPSSGTSPIMPSSCRTSSILTLSIYAMFSTVLFQIAFSPTSSVRNADGSFDCRHKNLALSNRSRFRSSNDCLCGGFNQVVGNNGQEQYLASIFFISRTNF
jgi:hypothetical protein